MQAVDDIDIGPANRIERPGFVLAVLEFALFVIGQRLAQCRSDSRPKVGACRQGKKHQTLSRRGRHQTG
jgi:hypothetical protein